jgi:hypothetical protein
MPTATGSISFLGASRFQGKWDAIGNDGTGSQLPGAPSSNYSTLLTNGGYHSSTNLTASNGDYWQVTRADDNPSNNATVDGKNDWSVNDWIIYSGSQWLKLDFEDTIASVITGDLTSSSFHMGAANDKHIIFATGSVHSGSSNLIYDYYSNNLIVSGGIRLADDIKLYFGSDSDAYIEFNEDGKNHLVLSGTTGTPGGKTAGLAFSGSNLVLDSRMVQSGTAGSGSFLAVNASSQVILTSSVGTISALNSRAENRLVTIGSTTSELDGEANLTFDGSNFSLTGSANVDGILSAIAVGNVSTISTDTAMIAGYNYALIGPITVAAGKTLTIPETSNVKIKDISEF